MAAQGHSDKMMFDMEVFRKKRSVMVFLHVEKIAPVDIHRCLLNIYGDKIVWCILAVATVLGKTSHILDSHVRLSFLEMKSDSISSSAQISRLLLRCCAHLSSIHLNIYFIALEMTGGNIGIPSRWDTRMLTQEQEEECMHVCQN